MRMQHSLPEMIDMSLFGSDFYRHIGRNMAIPFDEIKDEDYFNIPNIKFQPHGHLTLATAGQMEALNEAHDTQRMSGVQSAMLTAKQIKKRFPWINTHNIEGGCLGLESEEGLSIWQYQPSRKQYLLLLANQRPAISQLVHTYFRDGTTHGIFCKLSNLKTSIKVLII